MNNKPFLEVQTLLNLSLSHHFHPLLWPFCNCTVCLHTGICLLCLLQSKNCFKRRLSLGVLFCLVTERIMKANSTLQSSPGFAVNNEEVEIQFVLPHALF